MNENLNCPNCGAPVSGEICSYCGTVIYDFATINMDKPTYIKLKKDGNLFIFKALLTELSVEYRYDQMELYGDDRILDVVRVPEFDITAKFSGLTQYKGERRDA